MSCWFSRVFFFFLAFRFVSQNPVDASKKLHANSSKNVSPKSWHPHSAVLDPEQKSLKGLFSLLNIRHPKKFKPLNACLALRKKLALLRLLTWTDQSWDFLHPKKPLNLKKQKRFPRCNKNGCNTKMVHYLEDHPS